MGTLFMCGGIVTIVISLICLGVFDVDNGIKRLLHFLVVTGAVVCILSMSAKWIPTGYVGIRTLYGQISEKPCAPGLNWHIPVIEGVEKVNCKQQEIKFNNKIWCETSERTTLYMEDVAVDYAIEAEEAAWIWSHVEEYDTKLVKQTSVESGLKAASRQFTDVEVTDRSKIEPLCKETVQRALDQKYGKRVVTIYSVTIGNIDFSAEYNAAIEDAKQKKLEIEKADYVNQKLINEKKRQAEEKRITAEADAEEKRIQAEGYAKEQRIRSEADAAATLTRAKAEAEAIKLIGGVLTDDYNQYIHENQWDGKYPIAVGGETHLVYGLDGIDHETK